MTMDTDNPPHRLEQLRKEIHYHDYRYHVLDEPVISDFEYDQLMAELRKIETEHPEWVTPDSPTQRAGATPVRKFPKVGHPAPFSAWLTPTSRRRARLGKAYRRPGSAGIIHRFRGRAQDRRPDRRAALSGWALCPGGDPR